MMEYAEQMLEVYRNTWIFLGIASLMLLAALAAMFIGFGIPQILRKWRWIMVLAWVLAFAGGTGLSGMESRAEALSEQTKVRKETEL